MRDERVMLPFESVDKNEPPNDQANLKPYGK
jgi:hypothetical protein